MTTGEPWNPRAQTKMWIDICTNRNRTHPNCFEHSIRRSVLHCGRPRPKYTLRDTPCMNRFDDCQQRSFAATTVLRFWKAILDTNNKNPKFPWHRNFHPPTQMLKPTSKIYPFCHIHVLAIVAAILSRTSLNEHSGIQSLRVNLMILNNDRLRQHRSGDFRINCGHKKQNNMRHLIALVQEHAKTKQLTWHLKFHLPKRIVKSSECLIPQVASNIVTTILYHCCRRFELYESNVHEYWDPNRTHRNS